MGSLQSTYILGRKLRAVGNRRLPTSPVRSIQWLEDILLNEITEVLSAFLLDGLVRQPVDPIILERLGFELVDRLEVRSCLREFAL